MKKLMMWSAFLGGSFLAVMLSLTIYLGTNRVIVIADTGSITGLTGLSDLEELPGHELLLQESAGEGTSIRIPMENAIGAENITIENQYISRRLVVNIRGGTGFFYENNRITGYVEPVQKASYTVESEGVTLYLQLSELYEYESILDKGYLQVNLYKPSERYAKVVVLDAEISEDLSSPEREALYQIEEKLQALLEAESIRTYSAEDGQGEVLQENTLRLIDQTRASLYVGLKFDRDKDAEQFGSYVCYSGLYFRPWFTNGSFADKMERELVTAVEGRALGLVEMEDGILPEISIPAVTVCPGYLSHETEGKLLLQESYQERIAEGICAGILGAFEELEKE